jgi:hypothetical protein
MSKTKLLAVRELIQEGAYDAARSVLDTMPGHEIAEKWRDRLDEIAPPAEDRPLPGPTPEMAPLLPDDDLPTGTADAAPLPHDDLDHVSPADQSDMWETCMLIAEYDEESDTVLVALDKRGGPMRVIKREKLQMPHTLLLQTATEMGQYGWEVAGMDSSPKGNPFFLMRRRVAG